MTEGETIRRVKAYLDSFESRVKLCDFKAVDTAFSLGMDRQLMTSDEFERYYQLSQRFKRECDCVKRYPNK